MIFCQQVRMILPHTTFIHGVIWRMKPIDRNSIWKKSERKMRIKRNFGSFSGRTSVGEFQLFKQYRQCVYTCVSECVCVCYILASCCKTWITISFNIQSVCNIFNEDSVSIIGTLHVSALIGHLHTWRWPIRAETCSVLIIDTESSLKVCVCI
jgi:hypothetical protein